jgi:uncharacterized protein
MSGMHSGPQTRFLCDQNLGKLARWLRILGFDAEYMVGWDEKMIAQAMEGNRIFLTRKVSAAAKTGIIFIRHDHAREQLHELFSLLGLKEIPKPFTRCSICNTLLISASSDSVKGLIPEFVHHTHESFARCPACKRIYWKGTHISEIYDMIHHLLKEKT